VSTFGVRLSNVDEFTRKIDILCNIPTFNPQINNIYIIKRVYFHVPRHVICKHCILKIINKWYRWLHTYMDRDIGDKYPQERGSKGELYMPLKPKPYNYFYYEM
jgi:hypothetical protein